VSVQFHGQVIRYRIEFILLEVGWCTRDTVDWPATIVGESRDDMAMHVWDLLAGSGPVIECNSRCRSIGHCLRRWNDLVEDLVERTRDSPGNVIQPLVVSLGDDQRVCRRQGVCVQERQDIGCLMHHSSRNISIDDSTEDAILCHTRPKGC
jgi:hypothetical protein